MALERNYIIPLRKEWLKVPKYKRAKKAITGIKDFLKRHMKSDNIKVGEHLNLEIWKHGMKNPPHKVKITAIKDDEGTVTAEIFGKKYVAKEKVEKEEKKTGMAGKLQDALEKTKGPKKEETEEKEDKKSDDKEEKKTEKKTESKPVKKEEKPTEKKKEEPAKKSETKPSAKPVKKEDKPSSK